MNKQGFYGIVFLMLFLVGFALTGREADMPDIRRRSRLAMETVVEVQIRMVDLARDEQAFSDAFAEIDRIDALLSPHQAGSEVRRINMDPGTIVQITPELSTLLESSDYFWRLTDGSFDAALGALIEAWGFDGRSPAVPTDDARMAAQAVSGWGRVSLLDKQTLIRPPGLKLNFGGIGKGYAVDRAVEVLRQQGINQGMVNAGGEVRSLGGGWIVGIQHPRQPDQLLEMVRLDEMAIATSGDYEQSFFEEGQRYSHILDGRTGWPAQGMQSVTVLAKSCQEADALSTAFFVLGLEQGLLLAEQLPQVEAMFVDDEGKISTTSGFGAYLIGR